MIKQYKYPSIAYIKIINHWLPFTKNFLPMNKMHGGICDSRPIIWYQDNTLIKGKYIRIFKRTSQLQKVIVRIYSWKRCLSLFNSYPQTNSKITWETAEYPKRMLSFDEIFKYAKVIILSRKDLSEIENNSFIFF